MRDKRRILQGAILVGTGLLLLILTAACATQQPAKPTPAPPEPTAAPPEPTPTSPPEPTPTPPPEPTPEPVAKLASPLTAASDCATCHADIHEEWKESYHAKTITAMMGGFLKYINYLKENKGGVAREDLMGCLNCHAPAMRFASDEDLNQLVSFVEEGDSEAVSDIGVDCVSCHTLVASGKPWEHPGDKVVVYGPIDDPVEAKDPKSGEIAHESVFAKITQTAELCKSCHTYVTPADVHVEADWDIICSLTYDAWAEAVTGKQAGKQCQDCHMSKKDGKAAQMEGVDLPMRAVPGHAFPGWHSQAMLEQATDMTITANPEDGNLMVTIGINNKAGHRMPDT